MAEGRMLRRKVEGIVIPTTRPKTLAEFEAMMAQISAQQRELLAILARIKAIEAEFARGDDASDASEHESDAMLTLRVGATNAELRALRNDITRLHALDDALETERAETRWLN